MDAEVLMLSEVGRQGKRNIIWYHLHVEYKIWYTWTYLETRNRLSDTENKFMILKGEKEVEEGKIKRLGLMYTHYYQYK